MRLLVHGAPPPTPQSIAISCDPAPGQATLHFADHVRSRPIEAEGASIERILSTIEELLADAPAELDSPASTGKLAPAPPNTTDLERLAENEDRPDDAQPAAGPRRTIGGAGLGVSVERWPAPAGVAVGPRLDLAWGMGSWAATSFESIRFGSTPDTRLLAFEALVGVAWGAPFAETGPGAVVAAGGEWFSAAASSDPTGQRTSSSFIVDVGLRWGEALGSGALWLGVDARYRLRPPELPDPVAASLGRWSVIVSLGGALTVH